MAVESVRVPEVGESVTEGTIASWLTEPGATIAAGDPLFELATEKVDSEIPSPISGTVVELLIPKGGSVSVGDIVVTIDTEQSAVGEATHTPEAPAPTAAEEPAGQAEPEPAAEPAARARRTSTPEPGAPPLPPMPSGSGPARRASETTAAASSLPEPGENDTFQRFTRIRSLTGKITAESNATIPHALSMVEADHVAVMAARQVVKARGAPAPTALAFVAVAVARALGEHPVLNSSVGDKGLILHGDINLAFAIDTDQGLLAPVIHHADHLTVAGMADAIGDLATRARDKALTPNDMTGGTFSISNNGSVGSVLTSPIITPPQVAVLSTDRVVDRPVVIDRDGTKSIAIRPVGNLAMCWDHRAMDGADAARFLSRVKEIIETTDWSSLV
jgi:2-oxoglutarate dehydrogenase E2 component (dihydrolipoamide succinyltransferase)